MNFKKLKTISKALLLCCSSSFLFVSCKKNFTPPVVPNPAPFAFKVGKHVYNCATTFDGLETPRNLLMDGRAKLKFTVTGVNFTPQFQQTTTFAYNPGGGYSKIITNGNSTTELPASYYKVDWYNPEYDCVSIAKPESPQGTSIGGIGMSGETEFRLTCWVIEGQPGSFCAQPSGNCLRWFYTNKFPNDPNIPAACNATASFPAIFIAEADPTGFQGACN